ncbi:DUF2202 domain-containing protein [Plebeiibacterium sediminum]|uniref:DUF2202 domain-containing protein n=1 Tax=Plebeiibacterium sediminum TaxID=2992112 RepID=A0AAE3SFA8_9BACT|nr:DUF2202 domain-containing protein [Plebeiobacterium sediminum]MCW3785988.1 DUF2202 domain-containing protein [Plebeiobacterium sediminum]
MKKINRTLIIAGLMASQLIFAASCDEKEIIEEQVTELAYSSNEEINIDDLLANFVDTEPLTTAETKMLQFMKEEEKLARDVYYALNEIWNARVFTNISKSEERHIAAVMGLVEYYNLGSTEVLAPGEFESEEFKALYDQLVEQGSQSIEEAMKVGALIEELDIKDLQEKLDATSNENITMVFNNLLRGSRNHLRAFNRQLVKYGITYSPQYISQDQYDEIINGPNETGNR